MGTRIPLLTTDSKAKDMAEKLEMSTAEIGLSVRTTNCLEERGFSRSTTCSTAPARIC